MNILGVDNDDSSGLQILIFFPSVLQIPMNILGVDNDDFSGLQILIFFPSGLQIPMNILVVDNDAFSGLQIVNYKLLIINYLPLPFNSLK